MPNFVLLRNRKRPALTYNPHGVVFYSATAVWRLVPELATVIRPPGRHVVAEAEVRKHRQTRPHLNENTTTEIVIVIIIIIIIIQEKINVAFSPK